MKVSSFFIAFILFSLAYAQQFPIYELEPVVVTASRVPSTFSSVARNVIVITRGEIESTHVQSVQDLLEYASGVDLRQRGPHGVQADVSIRGCTYEQTLILIDGIKVNDPQTGHHNLDIPLQLEDVERIEILKGHGSRLYGPNALGGVINVITRTGDKKRIGLNGVTGDYGLFNAGFQLSYPFKITKHYFSISWRKSKGYIHNTDFNICNGYYHLTTKLGSGKANISIGYMDKEFGANSFYSNLFADQWEHTKTKFILTGINIRNSHITFSPRVYWKNHEDNFILDRKDPNWYKNHHEKDIYGFEFQSVLSSHLGVSAFGGELGKDRIKSNNLGNHSRNRGGFFFEHRFDPFKNLSLTFGTNAYYYSDWGWNVWPGVDLGFQFLGSLRFYSSVGRSFRVPTYTELYYDSPANKGNPDLKPEEAWTCELGLKLRERQLRLDFAIFRREGSNLIDWARPDANTYWEARNITRMNTSGLELNFCFNHIKHRCFPFKQVKIDYTFLKSDKEIKNFESGYVLDYLKHQLILDIEYPVIFQFRQNWKLRYEERVDGKKYYLCDIQINRIFKNMELFVKVTNIFNTCYTEIRGIPMPGRWATIGIKYNLMPK